MAWNGSPRQGGTWTTDPQPAQPSTAAPTTNWAPPAGIQPGTAQDIGTTDTKKVFDENKAAWFNPSHGEVNTQGLIGQFSDPNNRADVSNNTQSWFDQYRGQMPNISAEPGFGAYFENAKNRAAESINQAMAARGAYGSSAANDQTARAFTDLEGQRALKEADYNLQRLAEQRGWQGLGGQLAGAADNRSLGVAGLEKDWVNLLHGMGIDASRLGLDRTNAGTDAARAATADERTRGQDFFANQLAMGDRLVDIYKTVILPALENDGTWFSEASSGGVAEGNQAANNERTNTNDAIGTFNTLASLYGATR